MITAANLEKLCWQLSVPHWGICLEYLARPCQLHACPCPGGNGFVYKHSHICASSALPNSSAQQLPSKVRLHPTPICIPVQVSKMVLLHHQLHMPLRPMYSQVWHEQCWCHQIHYFKFQVYQDDPGRTWLQEQDHTWVVRCPYGALMLLAVLQGVRAIQASTWWQTGDLLGQS